MKYVLALYSVRADAPVRDREGLIAASTRMPSCLRRGVIDRDLARPHGARADHLREPRAPVTPQRRAQAGLPDARRRREPARRERPLRSRSHAPRRRDHGRRRRARKPGCSAPRGLGRAPPRSGRRAPARKPIRRGSSARALRAHVVGNLERPSTTWRSHSTSTATPRWARQHRQATDAGALPRGDVHAPASCRRSIPSSSSHARARDRLTAWAADTLRQPARAEAFLEEALDRRYSASPYETFFTGSGTMNFPPARRKASCCARISSLKFQVKRSTYSGRSSSSADGARIGR